MTHLRLLLTLFLSLPVVLAAEEPAAQTIGFHEGALLLTGGAGTTFSAGGSLIQTEQAYNRSLRYRALLAGATFNIGSLVLPPIIVPFSQNAGPISEVSLQYGLTNHFSAGLKAEHIQVNSSQAEGFPNLLSSTPGYYREAIWPGAVKVELYRGTSYMALVGFHPLHHARFDPYIELHAGILHYASQAHATVDFDPARFFYRRSRGSGAVFGGSLGAMFHLAPEVGLKVQLSGYSRLIRSGLPHRSLNTAHAEIGAVVNLVGVLREKGRPQELQFNRQTPQAQEPVSDRITQPQKSEIEPRQERAAESP